jgi:hypothetical protein
METLFTALQGEIGGVLETPWFPTAHPFGDTEELYIAVSLAVLV